MPVLPDRRIFQNNAVPTLADSLDMKSYTPSLDIFPKQSPFSDLAFDMVKLQAKDAVKDVQLLDNKASNGPLNGDAKRGLLDSDYAENKRDLMALINQIRSRSGLRSRVSHVPHGWMSPVHKQSADHRCGWKPIERQVLSYRSYLRGELAGPVPAVAWLTADQSSASSRDLHSSPDRGQTASRGG